MVVPPRFHDHFTCDDERPNLCRFSYKKIDSNYRVQFITDQFSLLIGTLIGVAFIDFCLIASFFINEDNGTEDENFGTNANERPQGG